MTTVAESLSYIPGFVDEYSYEIRQIEAAAERAAARIERETAKLTRPDGSPKYAPQEHQEQLAALHEAAGAEFDQAVQRYVTQGEQDEAKLKTEIAKLEGFDPFDALTADQQQAAASRREFVREDALTLRPSEVARRARAAVASGDKAASYLWWRYIGERIGVGRESATENGIPRTASSDPELIAALRELGAVFGIEDRAAKRRELEAKVRAARALPIAVRIARNGFDGTVERALTATTAHYRNRW